MMTNTFDVYYDCQACGLVNRRCQVPEREPGEAADEWVRRIGFSIGADHQLASPHCRSRHCDLKIPRPKGTEHLGMNPRH